MKDRSRLLHFVIHLIHPIPNFLLSFHLNTFYFFFLPSQPFLHASKSFKILENPSMPTRLTVLVHLSILAIIPLTGSQPGRRKEAACAPWKRRQLVGWQREIGSTRSSQGWRKGLEYYADPPRWGWKPAELLPSGSEWGPKRARSGQNNVKSALPTPGRNFRSPLLPRLALLLHPLLRQHRYPTTSLKYLSSPGGLTLVKWYRDTWTVGLLIFRSKPLENSPSSRLKYRPK